MRFLRNFFGLLALVAFSCLTMSTAGAAPIERFGLVAAHQNSNPGVADAPVQLAWGRPLSEIQDEQARNIRDRHCKVNNVWIKMHDGNLYPPIRC